MNLLPRTQLLIVLVSLSVIVSACSSPEPEPLRYGHDVCDYCRMIIADQKFGSEMVTQKGKIFRFDSIECLAAFEVEGRVDREAIHSRWVTDFSTGSLIDVRAATVVRSQTIKSPMGIGLVAFTPSNRQKDSLFADAAVTDWENTKLIVTDLWELK